MDVFSISKRSQVMSRIRSNGNKSTELRLISIMRRNGIKGWRRGSRLLGNPDFVFPNYRTIIFVDGDFWHGNPANFRLPSNNRKYWSAKIDANKNRDRYVSHALRCAGWSVLRLWESALCDEQMVVQALRARLRWRS